MFKIYGGATKFIQLTKDQKLIMSELPIWADVLFYNHRPEAVARRYPYKEVVTIEWDGNTAGKEHFDIVGYSYYKVSDLYFDKGDLIYYYGSLADGNQISSIQVAE